MVLVSNPVAITPDLCEVWKAITIAITGFECKWKYEGSNIGRIRNKSTNEILGFLNNKEGKLEVELVTNEGELKRVLIHKIVASLFCDKPNNPKNEKLEVRHKDRNKRNNRSDNLEWCTHQQLCCYTAESGALSGPKIRRPIEQVLNGKVIGTYANAARAAAATGCTKQLILLCCKRKRKSHGGYEWIRK